MSPKVDSGKNNRNGSRPFALICALLLALAAGSLHAQVYWSTLSAPATLTKEWLALSGGHRQHARVSDEGPV